MPKLTTRSALINYVKSQLGEPSITVEVTETQLSQIIDDTIQKFTEYAYGTLEAATVVQLAGMGEYPMPEGITNMIKVSKGAASNIMNFGANFGSGYVPNLWSEQHFSGSLTGNLIPNIITLSANATMLEKYFGDDIVYNFNHLKQTLQVLENYQGPVLLYYEYEYIPDESRDLIFNHEWVKKYSKAKTKELWSTVTGKFDQALVGGARINYDKMAQEAQMEIEKADEELLTKWSDPAPISIA